MGLKVYTKEASIVQRDNKISRQLTTHEQAPLDDTLLIQNYFLVLA
jgi:hypothetical protein